MFHSYHFDNFTEQWKYCLYPVLHMSTLGFFFFFGGYIYNIESILFSWLSYSSAIKFLKEKLFWIKDKQLQKLK